jgi:nitrate reductase delta subunit
MATLGKNHMSHLPKVLNALSKLLSYPDEHTVQTVELLYVLLMDELPEAASEASAFGSFVDQSELYEVEEAFTHTFDVNPACALEVGWHLFGEEYARGMFLVRMRQELRKYGLAESTELTDHLCHVLAVVAAMPDDEATRFVKVCVQPAVEKMNAALQDKDTPYAPVVSCLALVLRHIWGEAAEDNSPPAANRRDAFASDPLHAYPVAGVMAGEASSCGEPMDLVPLTIGASLEDDPNSDFMIHQAPAPTRKP